MSKYANSATLKPAKERRSDKSPHQRGQGNLDCVHCGRNNEFWVSGWTNKDDQGTRYVRMSFTQKDDQKKGEPEGGPGGDDIPF